MGSRQKLRSGLWLQISIKIQNSHCFGLNSSHKGWESEDPACLVHLPFGIVWILLIIAVQRKILVFLANLRVKYMTDRYIRVTGWPVEFVLYLNADQSLVSTGCRFDFRKLIICLLTAWFLKTPGKRKALPYSLSLKALCVYKLLILAILGRVHRVLIVIRSVIDSGDCLKQGFWLF